MSCFFEVLAQLRVPASEPMCMHARTALAALRRHTLRFCLPVWLTACGTPNAPEHTDAEVRFQLRAYDARGAPQPLAALPRRPEFVLSSSRPLTAAELLLFSGVPDDALAGDLQSLPLRAASTARRIAGRARAGPAELRLVPEAPLARGASYSLAIAGNVRVRAGPVLNPDGPGFLAAARVASEPAAGAAWLATAPAAGASGVPQNLAAVLLLLDGAVSGLAEGAWLQGPDGRAVAAELQLVPCEALDARAASCASLALRAQLRAGARYEIRSGAALRDAHGAPVEPLAASFQTNDDLDLAPPRFLPLGCLRDELPLAEPAGCALLGDRSLQLRLHAAEPAVATLRSAGRRTAALAADGGLTLQLDEILPGEAIELELRVADLAGNAVEAELHAQAAPELATLSISELRADPQGPEPAQEYVELENYGSRPIALRGCSLVDARDDDATAIEPDVELPPGARALLVADAFDASDPRDAMPPPGTRLVRVGPSLTRAGLANSGEPLLLRDALGRRLSAAPARAAEGQCLVRTGEDRRSGAQEEFELGGCTPGE